MVDPVNATGWTEMYDGNLITAAYTMFDQAFGGTGWLFVLLFFAYTIIAFIKTENVLLVWATSTLIVAASWGIGITSWSNTSSVIASVPIFVTLAGELGVILYSLFAKK